MKTITLNDEDYEDLKKLIAEYKTQDHDCQAYPRMWTVRCAHKVPCPEGYGTETDWAINIDGDYTYASSIAMDLNTDGCSDWIGEEGDERYEAFENYLSREHLSVMTIEDYQVAEFFTTIEDGWSISVCPVANEEVNELNASLFKDDAKWHIEHNKHNLMANPHTYAFTPFRMPKMHRLVDILMHIDDSEDENKDWL